MVNCYKVIVFFFTSVVVSSICTTISEKSLRREANDLFRRLTHTSVYDRRSPPNSSEAIRIRASLFVSVLGGLNSKIEEFTCQMMVRYEWRDPRLTYEELQWRQKQLLTLPLLEAEDWGQKLIWVPTIYVVNDKRSTKAKMPRENVYISITPAGDVVFVYRLNLKIYCAMNLYKFPFDSQTCRLQLQSWSLTTEKLLLEWNSNGSEPVVEVSDEFPMLEYRLTHVNTSETIDQLNHGNFSQLILGLTLSRETGHYILDYYIPAILIVMLSWVAFWLDSNATSARVALGVVTLMTSIKLSRGVTASLPKVSYVTVIEIYSIICIVFTFCTLLELAYENTVWRRKRDIQLKKVDTINVLAKTIKTPTLLRKTAENTPTMSTSASLSSIKSEPVVSGTPGSYRSLTVPTGDNVRLRPASSSVSIIVTDATPGTPPSTPVKPRTNMTPKEVANWLDIRSRFIFPLAFALTNALYWGLIWA